jgi:hypothetical protein
LVDPADIARIVGDAARLVRDGEIVVFGSSALAFWMEDPPPSRDVDLWTEPRERGEAVEALMGEESWYHDKHGAWVEVWGPETFAAPTDWRTRAKTLFNEDFSGVRLVVPHPHDILFSKLERMEPRDRDHMTRILARFPMTPERRKALASTTPAAALAEGHERRVRFEAGLAVLQGLIG